LADNAVSSKPKNFEIFMQRISELNDNEMFRSRALNLSMDAFDCELETLESCEADFITNTANIAKTSTQTEILQSCQSLDKDVDCLLDFLNKCPQMEKSSSFTILSYIYDKNRDIVDTCKQKTDEWLDPHHHSGISAIESNSGVCIHPKDIKECDQQFGDFDVGRDVIENVKECNLFDVYKKCITSAVEKSQCKPHVKEFAIKYLESRVKFAIDCRTYRKLFDESMAKNKILVETEMQSAVNVILEPSCKRKANPLMSVCTKQYQKRIDSITVASYSQSQQILPHLCCAYAEFTKCVTVITLLKCGKDEALTVQPIIESLRQVSSPHGCHHYEYGSTYCEPVLTSATNAGKQFSLAYLSVYYIISYIVLKLSNYL